MKSQNLISLKDRIFEIESTVKPLKLLYKDLPNVEIGNSNNPFNPKIDIYYSDTIYLDNPKFFFEHKYLFGTIQIYKDYDYIINNKSYNFRVFDKNKIHIYYDPEYLKEYIKISNLNKTLKNIFPKEFIKKLTDISIPFIIESINTHKLQIHKTSFLPEKLRLLMNFS